MTESKVNIKIRHVTVNALEAEKYEKIRPVAIIRDSDEPVMLSPRKERIRELIHIEHLNEEEKEILTNICEEYGDVFYLEGD